MLLCVEHRARTPSYARVRCNKISVNRTGLCFLRVGFRLSVHLKAYRQHRLLPTILRCSLQRQAYRRAYGAV
eukprot:jgi/Antlo1/1649/2272